MAVKTQTIRVRIEPKLKKNVKQLIRQNKDLPKLYGVIESLANEVKLSTKFSDHNLKCIWRNFRECHIQPDWRLICKIDSDHLYLVHTGSHPKIFE